MTTQAAPERSPALRLVGDLNHQLTREWLLTNGRGGFASGTPLGVNTRRYHGLLVAAAKPPLERWMMLSTLLERVTIGGKCTELANFQFDGGVFHPRGFEQLVGFETSNSPAEPFAEFVHEIDRAKVVKRVVLPRGLDEVRISYRITADPKAVLELELAPFVAMRDFHHLTQSFEGGFSFDTCKAACIVHAWRGGPRVWMSGRNATSGEVMQFESKPDWWFGFHYREESHRGQDCREDLFVPGWFRTAGTGEMVATFVARALFRDDAAPQGFPISDFRMPIQKTARASRSQPANPNTVADSVEQRLLDAADAFVVARRRADGVDARTIIAGYHWFGDWGRDTFIAMPGLLFETRRFDEAREILETFAGVQRNGLIPNRFSDYGDGCDYNSVDASLWFLHAAARYVDLTGDHDSWRRTLLPACRNVVDHFLRGTEFDIGVGPDGLVNAGNVHTQLTWMDAKFGDIVFTPRHGKPVEINALWHHGLRMLEKLTAKDSPGEAVRYRELADRAAGSFAGAFWNESGRYLYDVVRPEWQDAAVRPNQIFAVSLEYSPLTEAQQSAVLERVRKELLTPYGLRSLSPKDPAYKPRCEGSPFERDSAYHQGTVWGWLIGPYVEAYLRVNRYSLQAKGQMRTHLRALIDHLDEAGIGSVSEIFDGNPPHTPRACIAQAWSVSELLRAWNMTATQ